MKTQTIKSYVTTALCLAGLANAAAQGSQSKPNIVFILADDLGYGDVNCYNPDGKIATPNIDRIAANGIRFTDGHAGAALSTPSRYSILTGRYSFRSRLQSGVLGDDAAPLIEANRVTVGSFLQANGYNTAAFGKWHLGLTWPKTGGAINYNGRITDGPITRGFDHYFGINTNNNTFFIDDDIMPEAPTVPKPAGMYGGAGMMVPGWTYENMMPSFTNRVIDYIKNTSGKRDPNKPFFIYFATTIPHTPIAPIDEFKGTSNAHLIGDFIQQLDWEVGQVIQALEDQGILDNTLIIFSSDNGPMHWDGTNMQGPTGSIFKWGHNPSWPLRGKKSDIWEAGHRVPFVAQWPGQIPAGTVSNEMISQVDLMATFAAILGVNLPAGAGEDSYNMLPAFKAENTTPIRRELLNISGGGGLALRKGDWKLILAGGSRGFTSPQTDADAEALGLPPVQLYNLSDDIAEPDKKNLYTDADYQRKVKEMTAIIDSIKTGKSPIISQFSDFDLLRSNLTGNFYLGGDIILPNDVEWIPIGAKDAADENPTAFEGTLDGCGYSIKNLNINAKTSFKGLFGRLKHATVKNLNLETNISGGSMTGAVAGAMFGQSTVERVDVSGSVQGADEVGGIAGRISYDPNYQDYNTIHDCIVEADVAATGNNAGGIAGNTKKNAEITYGKIDINNVYVTGKVSASSTGTAASGNSAGLLANTEHNYVKLSNSAVLSSEITGSTPNYFYSRSVDPANLAQLNNLYAKEGINLAYQNSSDKGNGAAIDMTDKVLAQNAFTTSDLYVNTLGWDFKNIWYMDAAGGYPKLKMQDPPWTPTPVDLGSPVSTYEDLDAIRNDLTGTYHLTNDIIVPDGTEWIPIGAVSSNDGNPANFSGQIYGMGYAIKNLRISNGGNFSGFIGRLTDGGKVSNLRLENVNIKGGTPTGGLTATMFNGVFVEKVAVIGSITGAAEAGGISGRNNNNSLNKITDCYVYANVSGTGTGEVCVGGIIGRINGKAVEIDNSYFAGKIKAAATNRTNNYAGGLIGVINNNAGDASITATNAVVVADEITGGAPNLFIGTELQGTKLVCDNCYARSDIALVYADENAKGTGAAMVTESMKMDPLYLITEDFYTDTMGWDFENIWTMGEEYPYPIFMNQEEDPSLPSGIPVIFFPEKKNCDIFAIQNGIRIVPLEQLSFAVYDMTGRLIFSSQNISSTVDVSLNSGIYVVRTVCQGERNVEKVAVM